MVELPDSHFADFFKATEVKALRREYEMIMERARNTMRAVLLTIQEGDYDEAENMILDALGEPRKEPTNDN